jgi:hypothetical protein
LLGARLARVHDKDRAARRHQDQRHGEAVNTASDHDDIEARRGYD